MQFNYEYVNNDGHKRNNDNEHDRDKDENKNGGNNNGGNGNKGGNVQPTFTLLPGISSTDPVPGFLLPPDNGLAANSGYIVQDVNSAIRWTDITGANPVEEAFSTFFASLGSYDSFLDPRVIYNDATSQFIVSTGAIVLPNANHLLLGVSKDSNPNDGFTFHDGSSWDPGC